MGFHGNRHGWGPALRLGACLLGIFFINASLTAWAAPPPVVTVGADRNGQVRLGWDPVPSATFYEVRRFLDEVDASPTETPAFLSPTPTPMATLSAGEVLQYNDVDVTNGRQYQYELTTWDGGGPGVPSTVLVIPSEYPGTLNALSLYTNYSQSVSVSWGDPSTTFPIDHYEVYRYAWVLSPTATPTATPTGTLPTATSTPTGKTATPTPTSTYPTPFSVATLMASSPVPYATVTVPYFLDPSAATPGPSAYYYYWVRAVDSRQNDGAFPSLTSNGILPVSKAPVAPVLSLQAGPSVSPTVSPTGFGVRLIWTGPAPGEGISSYQILRDGVSLATVGVSAAATQVYDDTTSDKGDLTNQSTFYSIVASNTSGSVTTQSVTIILTRAQVSGSLVVTPNATIQAVTLTWGNAVTGTYGLSGYDVFRSFSGLPVGTGTITPTPIAFVSADPSQTATPYYVDQPMADANGSSYWVEAVDAVSWVGPKVAAQPATLLLAPTPPSSLVASGPVGNNRVQLSWTAGSAGFYGPVQAYRIYRMVPGVGASPTPVATVSSTLNQYLDVVTNASAQTPVVYQVSALDALGNSSDLTGLSNAVTLTSLVTPSAPSSAQVTGDNQSLVFSWAAAPTPDAVTDYRLFGSTWGQTQATTPTPTPWATLMTLSASTSVTQSGLSLFQIVVNYLLADNAAGSSAPTTLSGITVPTYQVQAVVPPASKSVSVSWNLTVPASTATPGIDGFRIYRSFSANSGYEALAEVATSQSYYVDTTVPAGTTAYYIVTVKSGTLAESPMFPTQVPGPKGQVVTWPNVPSSVTVLGGSNAATVSWAPNVAGENVVSYNVYHDGSATPLATVLPSPSPSYQSVETPGVLSVYQVSALNASGEGVECGAVSVLAAPAMTPQIGFTPPVGITSTPGLVWISGLTYSPDVAGYNLYRGVYATPSVTPQETQVATLTNPTPFVSDAGVVGYNNYYRVVAMDANGLEASHAASAYLSIGMPPGVPQSFTTYPASSYVSLVWNVPAGDASVTGYAVYREATMGATKTLLGFSSSPTPQFVDSSVPANSVYYYSVAGRNAAGEGGTTAETAVLELPGPTVHVTPNASSNTLVWVPIQPTATPPFYGYAVYRAQLPSTTLNYLSLVVASASTPNVFVDSSISAGLTYIYQVAPSTSSGALGGFSVPLTQVVMPQPVTVNSISGDAFGTLSWNYQGGGGTTYQVQRRMGTETDSSFQTIMTGVTGTDYVDNGLANKSMYVYRVITVSSSGLTAVSGSVQVLPAKPPVVTGFVRGDAIEQGVSLSWDPANPGGLDVQNQYPLAGYRIYRSLDNGGTYRLVSSCVGTSTLDPVDVLSGDSRTYQIRAYDNPPDEPGMVHETAYPAIRVDSLTADTALDRNAIRPNGTTQERSVNIRFVVTQNGNVSIKVYSISGVLVKNLLHDTFEKGVHWTSWDATNGNGQRVASGVYLVTTTMPNRQEVCKVAVIK